MEKTTHFNMVEIATNVIVFAGNARNLIMKALNAAYDEDFETAREYMDQAENELRAAHRTQTEVIQSEARGEKLEISLLMNHAQDTLMAAMTELNLAKQLVRMIQKFGGKQD
ncbi:PTS lactose/cellobiose transporter subunit IIA [Pelolinea submarina]|uniref:PTS system cellobiose-specific IIA component n=1 Tax=Pelolinea submarina TaxID=913107 RepID=A0A347ZWT1_9CHLR|nr:PTS lactose/cellobiose transporter subunit IIA [Pelolinea submarina]REG05505.1 PTS system cellobiose-specific IIA component [Pelolinea submarina]BBB49762.1 PTS system, cellobiose-specific IIA component [Pelolinea submarina]